MFSITEPDAGSNTHQLSTTAVRDGEELVLSGTRYYISGVDGAGAILVVARTGTDSRTGHGLLSLFLVPPDAPGLTAQPLPVAAAAEAALAAVDAAIQTHGGNGLSAEYGLVPLWSVARLLRIAPVNREMILNYVAGHSVGLPRSY